MLGADWQRTAPMDLMLIIAGFFVGVVALLGAFSEVEAGDVL
jgi:hypothetical protein